MPRCLSKLRADLDVLPSPIPNRPGLLVRDPFRYSNAVVVVPPPLVPCLTCFDGSHTALDLRDLLFGLTGGRVDVEEIADALTRGLSEAGLLHDEIFRAQRSQTWRAFAEAPLRNAAFAGGGYPEEPAALEQTLRSWIGEPPIRLVSNAPQESVVGIAAPHVSPSGGVSTYRAAYRALSPNIVSPDCTFVILGTSHYGRPDRFGLTRKPFQTPLGRATTDATMVDELTRAAPGAVDVEDYCHAIEHSIEFQLLFLHALFGPTLNIVPVLCGPFLHNPGTRERPEDEPEVARGLEALGELQAKHGRRLVWVLGVDMAHVGRRYGDSVDARAHANGMNTVAARDRARLDRITAADADGFWNLVHEQGTDDLKWCGSAPLYSFLRAVPGALGQLLHYDQWNIDDASVVSFAALSFVRP